MLQKTILYLFTLLLLLITGCTTVEKKVQTTQFNELENAPQWINYTSSSVELVIVEKKAKVSDNDFRTRRDIVIASSEQKMREKLLQNLRNIFKILSKDVVNYNSELYKKQSMLAIEKVISYALNKSQVISLWESPSETIYVQRVVKGETMENYLNKTIQAMFTDFPFVYDNYILYTEQGIVQTELLK